MISFGLGDNWSFEKQLLREGHVQSFIFFDHTVSLRSLFLRITKRIKLRNFSSTALIYRFLVLSRYTLDFKIRRHAHVVKKITANESSAKTTNLLEVSEEISEKEFILKVDIEGSEYLIVEQICRLSERIPLLIIEFHDTDSSRMQFEESITKLLKKYINCHVHANNFEALGSGGVPLALEFTFGRKDIYTGGDFIDTLPLSVVDSPSSENRTDHKISFV